MPSPRSRFRAPNPRPNGPNPQDSGVRLQKVLAEAGVASRRACEQLIEAGRVEVNGRIVDRLPVFVDPATDRIAVDGVNLRLKAGPAPLSRRGKKAAEQRAAERVYIMLHKPDKVLATTRDDAPEGEGRTTVLDLVKSPEGVRLFPVGRLDYHSTGLVLLTNDGELADRLTHARYGVTKTYRVTIKGVPSAGFIDDLRRRLGKDAPSPTPAAGVETGAPGGVRIAREAGATDTAGKTSPNTVLEITLREGKDRQLVPILEQIGGNVRKITRVGIGPLRLRGIAVGESRNLTRDEVAALKLAGGLQAGGGPRARDARPSKGAARRSDAASVNPPRPGRDTRRPAGGGEIFRDAPKGQRS